MPCVRLTNLHPDFYLLRPAVERLTQFVASQEKIACRKIQIIVTDDAMLNHLKRQFFNEDVLTDTISFSYHETDQPVEGEIYLSLDRIRENAAHYHTPFAREIVTVIVHSLLHLMGYDDATLSDRKRMFALQNFYVQQIDVCNLFRHHHRLPDLRDAR